MNAAAPPAGGPWYYGEPRLRVMVLLLGHANRPHRSTAAYIYGGFTHFGGFHTLPEYQGSHADPQFTLTTPPFSR